MNLSELRVATRMRILVALTLIGLVALCTVSLFRLHASMMDDRKQQTRYVVQLGLGVLQHFHALAQSGALSDADARKAAIETLRTLRYEGTNYIFVVSTTSHYILMPPRPEKEGTDASGTKDSTGKAIIPELVKAALAGGGFVDYLFPKPGGTDPQPKVSFAAQFGPWQWVLGTGIYVDDVDVEFRAIAWTLGGISAVLLIVLGVAGWGVGISIIRQLGGEPREAYEIRRDSPHGDL